jgi:hypothetical protein
VPAPMAIGLALLSSLSPGVAAVLVGVRNAGTTNDKAWVQRPCRKRPASQSPLPQTPGIWSYPLGVDPDETMIKALADLWRKGFPTPAAKNVLASQTAAGIDQSSGELVWDVAFIWVEWRGLSGYCVLRPVHPAAALYARAKATPGAIWLSVCLYRVPHAQQSSFPQMTS